MIRPDTVRLFLAGPVVLLLVVAVLAVVGLVGVAFGQADRLATLGAQASERLERGRGLPTLWGLAAGVLLFAATAVLFGTKVLALLGLLTMAAGFILAGLGVGVAALWYGRGLLCTLGRADADEPTALRLGLAAFFFAEFFPFVGWAVVLLAGAAGTGALLEVWIARRRGAP